MRHIAAAVAVIALVAGAAHAQGQGQGKNNDRGGGKPAEAGQQVGGERGQGNGGAERGKRAQGNDSPSMAQSMRASDDRGQGNAMREERGGGNESRGNGRSAERGAERAVERASNESRARGNGRGNDNRVVAVDRRDGDRGARIVRVRDFARLATRGLIDGCPPGLARKNPPCVPPGQARNASYGWDRPEFWGLRGFTDGRYFYDDGYLVRYAPSGGILGSIPLLGGALAVGYAWPD